MPASYKRGIVVDRLYASLNRKRIWFDSRLCHLQLSPKTKAQGLYPCVPLFQIQPVAFTILEGVCL